MTNTFHRGPKSFWGGLAPCALLVKRLSMNVKLGTFEASLASYECEAGNIWSILGKLS